MKGLSQTILIPVLKDLPLKAISYAEMLSAAYAKPISFLCFNKSLSDQLLPFGYPVAHSDLNLSEGIAHAIKDQDPVILWNHRWEYDKNPEFFFNTLSKLKKNGFFRYLIDLSYEPVSKHRSKTVKNRIVRSEQIQPSNSFNFNKGLK